MRTSTASTAERRTSAWVLSLAAVLVVMGTIGATPALAAQAQHVRIEIHETFVDDFLSDACGTEVSISFDASLNVTLRYNRDGLLVQEIDPAGGGTVTYSAATGNSFSFPFNTTIIDYGDGAAIGSTFTMTFVGLFGHVPGFLPSDAGRAVLTGFVDGFDEFGLPHLAVTDLVLVRGSSGRREVVPGICAALTA